MVEFKAKFDIFRFSLEARPMHHFSHFLQQVAGKKFRFYILRSNWIVVKWLSGSCLALTEKRSGIDPALGRLFVLPLATA